MKEKVRGLWAGKVYDMDPIRIIFNPAAQYDEYDREIDLVMDKVERGDSLETIHEVVYKVFHDSFCVCGDDVFCICGGKDNYKTLAQELYTLLAGE